MQRPNVRLYPLALAIQVFTACTDLPSESGSPGERDAPVLGQSAQALRVEKKPLSDLRAHAAELLAQSIESSAKLSIVFVLDGLRPDSINATE